MPHDVVVERRTLVPKTSGYPEELGVGVKLTVLVRGDRAAVPTAVLYCNGEEAGRLGAYASAACEAAIKKGNTVFAEVVDVMSPHLVRKRWLVTVYSVKGEAEMNETAKTGPVEPTPEGVLKIETVTLINGRRAEFYSDETLFALIAKQEAAIRQLQQIQHRPQALTEKLSHMNDQLKALVMLMDSVHASKAA